MTVPTDPPPPSSLPPPGWYPDPARQGEHRWWDGARWTEHVGTPPPGWASQRMATGSGTADLAGWWLRFGGYLLDAIIIGVPTFVIGLLVGVTQRGHTIEGTTGTHLDLAAQAVVVAIGLLTALAYPYLLLRHNGQTVGMMAVGVRAVDRESGARVTSGQAGRRVLAFFLIVSLWLQISVLIGFHHVYGPTPPAESIFRVLSFVALIATALWPLGNSDNQTLQDKIAGTVVVRSRL